MSTVKKSLVKGAVVLTVAGIITRLLGFVYRIYMTKNIGAEGMGLYQLIMPLYSLAWSISCSGITTTVSKLTAAENAKKEYGNIRRIVILAFSITVSLALIIAIAMFFGAETISTRLFNEPRTTMAIKILAAAVPFMAAGSSLRGYFSGLQKMQVPAISQVLEQCVRMGAIYLTASAMAVRGLEYACAAAVIGIFAGEVISFLYVLYRYRVYRLKEDSSGKPSIPTKALLTTIVSMALPLTLNRMTGSLLGTVENMLIPRGLQLFGMPSGDAIATFGKITGMAMPLIFFPSAFLISLSISIVPAVSEASAIKKTEYLSGMLSKSFLFTVIVGIGAAAVFFVIPDEIGRAIYDQNIGEYLFMLAFICPFWYLNITINGILNGFGEQSIIFRNNLISSVITILFIIFAVPQFGVSAFIFGWFISMVIVVFMGMHRIKKQINLMPMRESIIKLLLSGAASGLITELIARRYIFPSTSLSIGVVTSLTLLSALYALFIVFAGVADVFKVFLKSKN